MIYNWFKKLLNSIKKRLGFLVEENIVKNNHSSKPSNSSMEVITDTEPVNNPPPAEDNITDNPEEPITDFDNPKIKALLWKPKADYRDSVVIVAWSDNINSNDLMAKVKNRRGKVIFDGGTYPGYVRGVNKHGLYGGINFDLNRPVDKVKSGFKVSFYLKGYPNNPILVNNKHTEVVIEKPKQRLEINYKNNTNYDG